MSKEAWRGTPSTRPPSPMTMCRRARSFTSMTRGHVIVRGSRPVALPWWRWLSTIAASRLWATVTAWKSPVRWRFSSSLGTTWLRPAPAAPPLMEKVGPSEGCRRVRIGRRPMRANPWASPIAVVVLPSPRGVGVIAVTTTRAAVGGPGTWRGSLAT